MLVNAHTHLEFTGFPELCPGEPVAFADWLWTVIGQRQRRLDPEILAAQNAIENGIQMLLDAGTTHVGDISQTRLSVEPLLASGLAGVVYLEVIGTDPGPARDLLERTKREIDAWRKRENHMRVGLTLHAPYSLPPDVLADGAAWARDNAVPLCVHAAESPAEVEALLHGTGPMIDLLDKAKTPTPPIPYKRPLAYLDELGVLDASPLLVHMVQVDDDDLARVARSDARVLHCPRSNHLLSCGRMPLEHYIAAGVPVALGTDSLSSSPSLNVCDEAEFAVGLHDGHVSAEQVRGLLQYDPFTS